MAKDKSNLMVSVVIISLIVGAIAGAVSAMIISGDSDKTENELIKEFYNVETAVHVSPHGIRKHMTDANQDFILVDLRSQQEYENEHIVGAVSIPAYATPDKSDYGAVNRIVSSFRELRAENPDKDIIVYCYSIPCMTGRKIGKTLADNEIYVKHLGVGWNEWKYYWDLWNHDQETKVSPEDYTIGGSEPGSIAEGVEGSGCPIEGGFGC